MLPGSFLVPYIIASGSKQNLRESTGKEFKTRTTQKGNGNRITELKQNEPEEAVGSGSTTGFLNPCSGPAGNPPQGKTGNEWKNS